MKTVTIFQFKITLFFRLVLVCVLLNIFQMSIKSQKADFPYSVNKKDYVLLPLSIATNFSAGALSDKMLFNLTAEEIEKLDRNSINGFDRSATFNWNRDLNTVSDVFAEALPILPAAFFIPQIYNKEWENVAALGIMYVEIYMFTKGVTDLTKSVTGRVRPYLYNTSFSVDERFGFQGIEAPEASSSFISGHTSGAFAAAVFLGKAFNDIYGKSTWSYIVWGSSLTMATITAYSRVAAGEHFPTDVIAGAVVGSAIGYFIPVLHKKKIEKTTLSVLPNSFRFVYSF